MKELIRLLRKRIDQKSIGFNAEIAEKHEDDVDKLLAQVLPQDLVKFGLIPELVGRVPVTVSLEMLDHDALIRILTEPKNAIVKQYQKLLELDGVKLVFDDSALNEIADISLKRKDRSQRTSGNHGKYNGMGTGIEFAKSVDSADGTI